MNRAYVSLLKRNVLFYSVLVGAVLILDRITKLWAIQYCSSPVIINKFLSLSLSYNKGISWSLLSTDNQHLFMCTTGVILLFMAFFVMYMRRHYMRGNVIVGELLILSGGIANCIDRFVYQGVPDFIVFSYDSWYWPSFNIADAAIVMGCLFMIYTVKE